MCLVVEIQGSRGARRHETHLGRLQAALKGMLRSPLRSKGWGHDEVQPSSGKPKDWCRMAITMLDGLWLGRVSG